MQQLQKALPTVTIYIGINNPTYSGMIVTIWAKEIKKNVELRIADHELAKWTESQAEFISMITEL